jgi:EpsI family protein
MKNLRFWTVAVLLAATALLLHARADVDRNPPSEPLGEFPKTIAGWSGSDVPIAQSALDILGPGDFLSRTYAKGGESLPIGLFIGYFPSQRDGAAIHTPMVCLPSAGWAFDSQQYVVLNDALGKPHQVGEYIISNGEIRQFVIYWYQAHGRSMANDYVAKIHMMADALLLNRTDGALVRVITPIGSREGLAPARTRAEGFAAQLAPLLPRFIPD